MLRLDDDTFVNHVQFGQELELVVQFKVVDALTLGVSIHTVNEDVKYVSFLQWVYWIFAAPGSY